MPIPFRSPIEKPPTERPSVPSKKAGFKEAGPGIGDELGDKAASVDKYKQGLETFKAKHRRPKPELKPETTSPNPVESVFGKKAYIKTRDLKYKAGKAKEIKVPETHSFFQKKERESIIERHFADKKEYGTYISKKEYEQRIKKLEKQAPWLKSPTEKKQVKRDIDVLKKLHNKAA